jgi:hypothetical protein
MTLALFSQLSPYFSRRISVAFRYDERVEADIAAVAQALGQPCLLFYIPGLF